MAEVTERGTSRTVQTKKWKLHYHDAGEGYPVIMLHGAGPGATGWSNFSRNVAGLSSRYRMLALDFPGWGDSDTLDPTEYPRNAANAEATLLLMDELGIEKAALVGNSMGGAATLEFAARYPDRLSHCITMGAGFFVGPNVYSPGGLTEGLRIVRETYQDPSPANFRRLVSIFVYDSSFVSDELCEMRSRNSLKNPEHLKNFLKGYGPNGAIGNWGLPPGELLAKLAAYQGPSLFIHGRDDRVVPMENSLKLVSLVPNSVAHIVNRCGHWTQIEHADAFNALIDAFLQTHGVEARGDASRAPRADPAATKERAWGG